jgi:hypothetical protein
MFNVRHNVSRMSGTTYRADCATGRLASALEQSLDPLSDRVHNPMVPVDLIVGGLRRDDLFGSLR